MDRHDLWKARFAVCSLPRRVGIDTNHPLTSGDSPCRPMPSCCSRRTTKRSQLFTEFERAGDNAEKTKGRLVDKIIELLTVHTYIENEVMYPRVRELLPDLEDDILESYEEHHVADAVYGADHDEAG